MSQQHLGHCGFGLSLSWRTLERHGKRAHPTPGCHDPDQSDRSRSTFQTTKDQPAHSKSNTFFIESKNSAEREPKTWPTPWQQVNCSFYNPAYLQIQGCMQRHLSRIWELEEERSEVQFILSHRSSMRPAYATRDHVPTEHNLWTWVGKGTWRGGEMS